MTLRGTLDAATVGRFWAPVLRAAASSRSGPLLLDVSAARGGTALAALLAAALARHGDATLHGAAPELAALVRQAAVAPPAAPPRPADWNFTGLAVRLGRRIGDTLAFAGESLVAVATLPARRRQIPVSDAARLMDQAGFRAVPLVLLLGYLMGLILAFQGSIPLRRFGAELFVVNLVGLSLLRELGPLLTAVVLAGRTGSAYAAELGTMKVNEELAALDVMGVSAVSMLVLPRLAAAVLVTPVLTLLLEGAGLLGMLTVMLGFGFAPAAIWAQLLRAVHGRDLWTGLFKAVVFGAAVAGIGCRAGMAAGTGPRAVGLAATAAVVGGIVSTVVLDGVFAILFYRLGL